MTQLPPPHYAPPAGPHVSSLAIASLVLGILWLGFIGSALALVFGLLALDQIGKGQATGKGLAVAGIILGALPFAALTLLLR